MRSDSVARLPLIGVTIVIATLGLVAATGVLGYFTRALVQEAKGARGEAENARHEMEEARHLSVRPYLAFDVYPLGGKAGELLIRNVGRGPALDVELVLAFNGPDEHRRWAEASIVPGESHQLNLPEPFNADMNAALTQPLAIQIEGGMTDLYGRRIAVARHLDASEWWAKNVEARTRIAGRNKLLDEQ